MLKKIELIWSFLFIPIFSTEISSLEPDSFRDTASISVKNLDGQIKASNEDRDALSDLQNPISQAKKYYEDIAGSIDVVVDSYKSEISKLDAQIEIRNRQLEFQQDSESNLKSKIEEQVQVFRKASNQKTHWAALELTPEDRAEPNLASEIAKNEAKLVESRAQIKMLGAKLRKTLSEIKDINSGITELQKKINDFELKIDNLQKVKELATKTVNDLDRLEEIRLSFHSNLRVNQAPDPEYEIDLSRYAQDFEPATESEGSVSPRMQFESAEEVQNYLDKSNLDRMREEAELERSLSESSSDNGVTPALRDYLNEAESDLRALNEYRDQMSLKDKFVDSLKYFFKEYLKGKVTRTEIKSSPKTSVKGKINILENKVRRFRQNPQDAETQRAFDADRPHYSDLIRLPEFEPRAL